MLWYRLTDLWKNAENIYSAVISAGEKAAEEGGGEYLEMLRNIGNEGHFAELNADDLRVAFRTLISESVSYMIGKRLGIDMPETDTMTLRSSGYSTR